MIPGMTVNLGMFLPIIADGPAGSALYTTPGTYTWVAPAGVRSVSVVAVGGGGSGGTLGSVAGGDSYFINISTVKGGGGMAWSGSSYTSRTRSTFVGDGGGQGGIVGTGVWPAGAGGAGGYNGTGGDGTNNYSSNGFAAAAGSGGGGGGSSGAGSTGAGGGGVGLYGLGADGAGGVFSGGGGGGGSGGSNGNIAGTSITNGNGGSYGGGGGGPSGAWIGGLGGALGWKNNIAVTPGQSYTVVVGAGGNYNGTVSNGAGGGVRIVYPGTKRQFPSTSVGLGTP